MSLRLKELLAPVLLPEELALLVGSYDVVGDIAIIIIPDELLHRRELIGKTIMGNNKKIRVVARRAGHYSGEFRTIELEIIAGENRKETEVIEFGVRLCLDVEKTYYSVRSGNERRRVASLVNPGEKVLVLFSGVGPYPLVIAKHGKPSRVVGVEKNATAHEYAVKNLQLNRKIKNVNFMLMDVAGLAAKVDERFDRIVMPLPTLGHQFLPEAFALLSAEGGTIHYYEMAKEGAFEEAVARVEKECKKLGRQLEDSLVTRCGHCGPRSYRVCVDAQIR